jgi:azurin
VSDRVSTTITTSPSNPPSTGPGAARYFIVGQTSQGPTVPTVVRSLGEYFSTFGDRTGGASMFDAAQLALRTGVSEVVVCRAYGPTPVRATVSLDTGKIVVTAKNVGAYANGWTAAWNASTTTLTIVAATPRGATKTETYTGTTATALVAQASASRYVTVTSSGTLPAATIAATALATGTDDYGNVDWATVLAAIDAEYGPGCIATPGVAHTASGQALFTHAAETHRLALTTAAAGSTVGTAASAAATAQAYTDSTHGVLVWPHVVVPAGARLKKTVDPTALAAGVRARALASGPGESALAERYARQVADVETEFSVQSPDWSTANAARVSVLRRVAGVMRVYSWQTLDASPTTLLPAQYRDMVNQIAWQAEQALEGYIGQPGTSATYSAAAGDLSGIVSAYAAYLEPRIVGAGQVDPGFIVSVSGGDDPSDNIISADISLRFAESVEFVELNVVVGDATSDI